MRFRYFQTPCTLLFCGVLLSIPAPAQKRSQPVRTPFVPPAGKVLHIAGQDRESFSDYLRTFAGGPGGLPMPAGAAFYTSLRLTGTSKPHANEPGDNHQDLPYLLEQMQGRKMVLQWALYLHSSELVPVNKGELDQSIDALADLISRCGRPAYFRIGYEFDGPHNRYDPGEYAPC